jgi:hypothetical protein
MDTEPSELVADTIALGYIVAKFVDVIYVLFVKCRFRYV